MLRTHRLLTVGVRFRRRRLLDRPGGHASGARHCRHAFSTAHHRHQFGYHSLREQCFAREGLRSTCPLTSQHSGLTTQWPDRTSTLHEAFGVSHRPLAPWRWATTHDLVDPAEAMSASPDELQLERPFPITGNLDQDMATGLGQHRLQPCSVANVRRSPIRRRLFLVMAEVLSTSSFRTVSRTVLVNCLFGPSGPVSDRSRPPPCPGVPIPPRRSWCSGQLRSLLHHIVQCRHLGNTSPSNHSVREL